MYKLVYKCLACNNLYRGLQTIGAHIRVNGQKLVTCEVECPEGIQLSLSQRKVLFQVSKKLLCCTCGREFADKNSLIGHEYNVHGIRSTKMYKCDHCDFTTAQSQIFKIHMRRKHSNTRTELCELCGKAFYDRPSVVVHRKYVHTESQRKYNCRHCNLMFKAVADRKRHEALHAGIKGFQCSYCNKSFAQQYNLKVHERIHTGYKPYTCEACGSSFAQKNSLDVHMAKHGIGKTPKASASKRGKTALIPELVSQLPPQFERETHRVDPESLFCSQKQQKKVHEQLQHQPCVPTKSWVPDAQYQDIPQNLSQDPSSRVETFIIPGYTGIIFPSMSSTTGPCFKNL